MLFTRFRKAGLTIILALGSVAAHATPVSFGSDYGSTGFVSWANDNGFSKQFGGNVRWGSGTNNGDWEYAIVNGGDIPFTQGQTAWNSGSNTHDVLFSYDGSSVDLGLSGIGSLTTGLSAGGINTLLLRVRDSIADYTMLNNICVDLFNNGSGCDYTFSSLIGDGNAEYWGVVNAGLGGGFSVFANANLAGPRSAGSDPMYQFKVGTSTAQVPEPSAVLLLGIGLLLLVAGTRRRLAS